MEKEEYLDDIKNDVIEILHEFMQNKEKRKE